jgi:hypothetical protein
MKNAKLLLLSALTIVSLSLTSCGDDDSDGGGNIVGKWAYDKEGVTAGGHDVLEDYPFHQEGCEKDYIEFDATTVKDVSHESDCSTDIDSNPYTKSGNTLTIGTGADAETVKVVKVNGTDLRLETTYTIQGQTGTTVSTFKKVK